MSTNDITKFTGEEKILPDEIDTKSKNDLTSRLSTEAKILLDEINMSYPSPSKDQESSKSIENNDNINSNNPWYLKSLENFLYLCCPQCDYKDRDRDHFLEHAWKNHPMSRPFVRPSSKKPQMSYAQLIAEALNNSPDGMLTLSEIYLAISRKHPYYLMDSKNWQNSIRHTMTISKSFTKIPRHPVLEGRGSYWKVTPGASIKENWKKSEEFKYELNKVTTSNEALETAGKMIIGKNNSNTSKLILDVHAKRSSIPKMKIISYKDQANKNRNAMSILFDDTESEKKVHLKSKATNKRSMIQCHGCDKTFSDNYELKQHMEQCVLKITVKEEPIEITCEKEFQDGTMQVKQEIHMGHPAIDDGANELVGTQIKQERFIEDEEQPSGSNDDTESSSNYYNPGGDDDIINPAQLAECILEPQVKTESKNLQPAQSTELRQTSQKTLANKNRVPFYECSFCGEKFEEFSSVKNHMDSKHTTNSLKYKSMPNF